MRATPARFLPMVLLALAAWGSSRLPGVIGPLALYPALGVFPGMALAPWLAGRGRSAPRWTIGLTLAPLVAALAGAALMLLGVTIAAAARGIALAGLVGWALGEWRRPTSADDGPIAEPAPDRRFVLGLGVALAAAVTLPWLFNPFLLVRFDSWIHGGLVWEILKHGVPPEDPRFAGMPIHYVWLFNLFVAQLTALGSGDPFVIMALVNTVNLAVCVSLAYRIGLTLWRDRGAAAGSALLLVLGLNAGAWLLNVLRVVRALFRPQGTVQARAIFDEMGLGTTRVLHGLAAPHALMVSFLDKFTIGTALNAAWLMMLLYLWALLRWLDEGERVSLAWAVAGAAGMLFFHGVVGLSVLPVTLAALALALRAGPRWFGAPERGRLLAFAGATALGILLAAPYTLAITRAWTPLAGGVAHTWLRPGWTMPWTLATSCAVTAAFAARPIAGIVARRPPGATLLLLFTALMALFASVVHLPLDNESKFVFQVFMPLALIGGVAFLPAGRAILSRWGALPGGAALALVFLTGPVLTLHGYSVDREGERRPELHPAPGENRLYGWIRDSTDTRAVFVDHRGRDLIMVRGQRRLWVGTPSGPEKAGFPADEMAARRAVEDDLYGAARALDEDAERLSRLGRPVYVLYRAADFTAPEAPSILAARHPRFDRAYDRDGFLLLRVRS